MLLASATEPAVPAPFDPERQLAALADSAVEHVLIGGLAAALHGSPTATNDADICPRRDPDNLQRLSRALRSLDARIRTDRDPEGFAFDCSAAFLSDVELVNLTTVAGDLDIAFHPAGVGGYEQLIAAAVEVEVGDIVVLVASLDDIIHSKETADRPKDRAVLPVLRALRDEIGR